LDGIFLFGSDEAGNKIRVPKTVRMNSEAETSRRSQNRGDEPWHLRLFIAGYTPASMAAISSLKVLEQEFLPPNSNLEIIDLLENPDAGRRDHVLAIPTLVRVKPPPVRRIIGNLNDFPRTLKTLGFST
jgi:circadian clock protein KaiB